MIDNNKKKLKDRRQLLRSVLRYATLGLIGISTGAVFKKRQKLHRQGKCINKGLCCNCRVFDTCDRPPALSAKKVMEAKNNG